MQKSELKGNEPSPWLGFEFECVVSSLSMLVCVGQVEHQDISCKNKWKSLVLS